jgi:hypothetical protein
MSTEWQVTRPKRGWRAAVELAAAASIVAAIIVTILGLASDKGRDDIARTYARQFGVRGEDDCPRNLGGAFWFSCASEVRKLRGGQMTVPGRQQPGPVRQP